jgi:midasin (ATPase involved in ribosome maturation)
MKFTTNPWSVMEEALAFESLRTMFVWGPPGIGKTYAGYHSGRIKRGVYAVTLTDETSAAELRGHFIFKGGDTVWHDGPFTRAMREGARLVINEISNASADVLALLFPVLESFETARLTLPNGETVRPSSGFHVIATDNRSPEQLPEALQDRFMAYIEVTEMHPDALTGVSPELIAVARQTIGEGDRLVSARGWKHLEILSKKFCLHDACRMAFGMERGSMIADALTVALRKQAEEVQEKALKAVTGEADAV